MYQTHSTRWLLLSAVAFMILLGSTFLLTRYYAVGIYPRFGMPMMRGVWGFGLGILWIFFIIMAFMFIGRLIFWGSWRGVRRGYWRSDSAEEILRQRYARGEVTKEQFDQMMRDLQQGRS